MDSIYFAGWLAAVVLGVVKMMIGASTAASIKASNLRTIGLHYSPWSGTFTNKKVSTASWIFCILYALGLAPIFSWLTVASGSWSFVSSRVNRAEPPEKLKVLQYKIAATRLSKDEMIRACPQSRLT